MARSRESDMGSLLAEYGMVTERQLEKARDQAEKFHEPLEKVVARMGFATEKEITEVMGRKMGVDFVDLEEREYDGELVHAVPERFTHQYKVFPVELRENRLTLAMVDPFDVIAIDDIRLVTGYDIEPVIATEGAIMDAINRHYSTTAMVEANDVLKGLSAADVEAFEADNADEEEFSPEQIKELVNEAPIVRVVNLIISQAISDKASDIHIEPETKLVRVRYRVDGVLHDVMEPPRHIHAPMVSRLKIMSSMDIAERRVPQDGKIHMRHDHREFDLRVSTIPTVHGEKVVMRILDKGSVTLGLNNLGFYPDVQSRLEQIVEKPYGMLLVTGPTGSGKSTSLYSILNRLNKGEVNIVTVEDPVEYQIQGISQVQQNEKAGLTFATALRAFLRQDPDIIMVGEIRDQETAKTAVEAALTGHLVLSTLHTNDAAGAVTRLTEMGVEPFLCASSLIGVLAQRLARCICPNCRESYTPPVESVRRFGLSAYTDSEIVFYRGRGCDHCKMTGYRGRTGIHELLTMSDRIRGLILQRASTAELRQCAIEEGMKTMPDDGLRKVLDGVTTIEECLRVVYIEGQEL
ncbi:MAG: type II secretion system ATPase GspE [Candidatus Eremiobacteraeota bacterium]|nr:type II secretion system ATPase GspE [Candidatus Eremiobacteraeota bacterium]